MIRPRDIRDQLRKTGLSVHRNVRLRTPDGMYIVWTYRHEPGTYEDDEIVWKNIYLQVDLWGRDPPEDAMDEAADMIDSLMSEMGFGGISRTDDYEDATGLYRIMQTMSIRTEVD